MTTEQLLLGIRHQEGLHELKKSESPAVISYHASVAQKEILRATLILEAEAEVNFVANQARYNSGSWTFLASALRIKGGVNQDLQFTPIEVKSKTWIDVLRHRSARMSLAVSGVPRYVCHLMNNPMALEFYGTPTTAGAVKILYTRGHTSADDISDDVDPLIPDDCADLLVYGTILKMFEARVYENEDNVKLRERALQYFLSQYGAKLNEARSFRANLGDTPYLTFPRRKI